jgi:hypothetical protein
MPYRRTRSRELQIRRKRVIGAWVLFMVITLAGVLIFALSV